MFRVFLLNLSTAPIGLASQASLAFAAFVKPIVGLAHHRARRLRLSSHARSVHRQVRSTSPFANDLAATLRIDSAPLHPRATSWPSGYGLGLPRNTQQRSQVLTQWQALSPTLMGCRRDCRAKTTNLKGFINENSTPLHASDLCNRFTGLD